MNATAQFKLEVEAGRVAAIVSAACKYDTSGPREFGVVAMFTAAANALRTNESSNAGFNAGPHHLQADGMGSATYTNGNLTLQFLTPDVLHIAATLIEVDD